MKYFISALVALSLTACASPYVKPEWPGAPAELQNPPPALKEIPAGATGTEVFEVVIDNYAAYHKLANQVSGWQRWYQEQQKIFDRTK